MDFRQLKAIESVNKKKLLSLFPTLTDESGIYILTRFDGGFKYAYVGQSRHILTRIAQHMTGYQHIDLSLKKHGWKSENNQSGWSVLTIKCCEGELDAKEQFYIKECAKAGYQLRNKTAGGQSDGKVVIAETKPQKGYHEGLRKGYSNAKKDVAKLFKKNLSFTFQGYEKPTKNQEKAMQKFREFLNLED